MALPCFFDSDWEAPLRRVTCVVDFLDEGCAGPRAAITVASQRQVEVFLAGEALILTGSRATLFEFEGCWHGTKIVLHERLDSQTILHPCPNWSPAHCLRAREVCSGLGALGLGASRLGVQVCARNDMQPNTVAWLRAQVPDTPVTAGDICCPQVVYELYASSPGPAGLLAGFSCQPFSLLGDKKGADDARAKSLPGVLRAAYLLQASFLLLECVVPASVNPEVRRCLDAFAKVSGFQAKEVELDLQSVWPCKRKRWWCLFVPAKVPLQDIRPWDGPSPWRVVRDVLPCPVASKSEVQELLLTDEELVAFQKRRPLPGYLLRLDGVLATALHSWGAQTRPCPCGCRLRFKEQRLDQGGICAVLVREADGPQGQPNYRHMSAREVGLLNGLSPLFPFGNQHRLALCLVGQLASPMQSCWVLQHLVNALSQLAELDLRAADPIASLHTQCHELLAQAELAGLRSVPLPASVTMPPVELAQPSPWHAEAAGFLNTEEMGWTRVVVPQQCFLSHMLAEYSYDASRVLQVQGADGWLLPRPSLLRAGEVVHVWCAPAALSEGALAQQSAALPRNVGAFLQPCIPASARQLGIQAQDGWVADDQMRRALDALAAEAGRPVQVLDPLFLQRAIYAESPSEMAGMLCPLHPGEEVISAAIAHGQWVALYWQVQFGRVVAWASCTQGPCAELVAKADWMFGKCVRVGLGGFAFQTEAARPVLPGLCGPLAVAGLAVRLSGKAPCDTQAAVVLAQQVLTLRPPDSMALVRAPVLLGGGPEVLLIQSVAALLVQHGVAEAEAVPRSQALLARLGAEALQQAVSCSAPWKQLKAVASLAKPPIQLILPSELQQQINLRTQHAARGGGRGRRKKQGFKDAPASAHPVSLRSLCPPKWRCPQESSSMLPRARSCQAFRWLMWALRLKALSLLLLRKLCLT